MDPLANLDSLIAPLSTVFFVTESIFKWDACIWSLVMKLGVI